MSCCEWTTFISALSVAYNDDDDSVGAEDNPDQVLIVFVIMLVQWLYLSLIRPLASPLAMTVEVASATCECMVALMVRPSWRFFFFFACNCLFSPPLFDSTRIKRLFFFTFAKSFKIFVFLLAYVVPCGEMNSASNEMISSPNTPVCSSSLPTPRRTGSSTTLGRPRDTVPS